MTNEERLIIADNVSRILSWCSVINCKE